MSWSLSTISSSTFSDELISIVSVKWSPARPAVFAAATSDGNIFFYDLLENNTFPVICLDSNKALANSSILEVTEIKTYQKKKVSLSSSCKLVNFEFNNVQKSIVSAMTKNGQIIIWKIMPKLIHQIKDEENDFKKMFLIKK